MTEVTTHTDGKPDNERVYANIVMSLAVHQASEQTRDGREVLVAPCKCMRGGDVLNGILYPNDVVREATYSFNGVQVPLEHPTDPEGRFVPARSNAALNSNFIGAHMENVRFENDAGADVGRIVGDIVIDVERANSTDGGQAVLAAFRAGDPISTSTGLYLDVMATPGADNHAYVASWVYADHNAILLQDTPAASTDEGTGVFVNRKGEESTLRIFTANVANPDIPAAPAVNPNPAIAGASATNQESGLLKQLADLIIGRMNGGNATHSETEATMADDATKTDGSAASSEAVNAVTKEVADLKAGLPEMIANAVNEAVKPLVEAHEATAKANADAEAKERAELTEKVVAANTAGMTAEDCEATPMAVLRKVANSGGEADGTAATINRSGDKATNSDSYSEADLDAELNAGKDSENG